MFGWYHSSLIYIEKYCINYYMHSIHTHDVNCINASVVIWIQALNYLSMNIIIPMTFVEGYVIGINWRRPGFVRSFKWNQTDTKWQPQRCITFGVRRRHMSSSASYRRLQFFWLLPKVNKFTYCLSNHFNMNGKV